jgi:hypothetical protein
MSKDDLILFIAMVVSLFLWAMAILFWGIWIERYVTRNEERPASFLRWRFLRDYRTARKIAARQGRKPWFLTCFEWSAGLGMFGFIATMTYICVNSFH